MNFVAIDFETANEKRASPCSVGLIVIKEGICVEKISRLIRPPELRFGWYNTRVHGITESDVKDQPEFSDVWPDICPFVDGQLVLAHNASFDMSVLRNTLDVYGIPHPQVQYGCTRLIAKRVWPGLPCYTLDYIALRLGVVFRHHDACEDAMACAEIAKGACQEVGATSIAEMFRCLQIHSGCMNPRGYQPPWDECTLRPAATTTKSGLRKLVSSSQDLDPAHPLFGKVVIFTGAMDSMSRETAIQAVVDVGGQCGNSVSRRTNYLVIGDLELDRFHEGHKTGKLKKAEELCAEGYAVEIISEHEFLELLGSQ